MYNLDMSRKSLTKNKKKKKKKSLLMESKIPKMAVCRVKVRYIRLSPTINI